MARKFKLNAGVIGLGIIGERVAANLRTAGFQVYVWNRTPKPAPNFLASPAEVAGICEVIQLVVADSVALFETINAMGSALTPKHTVICSATIGAQATEEAARMVTGYGAKFLDAPFTGSKEAAEKGELVYYIGGDDEAFKRAEPVLKASSKAIVRIGEIGHAATIKIATNMLAATMVETLVEACAIVQRSGVDLNALTKALEHHGVRSGLLDAKLPKIIAKDYDTHFSVKHMFKDVQLAIQAANNFDIDIPATTATAGVLYSSINHGWADMDYSAIAKFYEMPELETEPALAPLPEVTEPAIEAVQAGESEAETDASVNETPVLETPAPESNGPTSAAEHPGISGETVPKTETPVAAPAVLAEKVRKPLPPIKEKSKSWFSVRRDE